MVEKEIFEQVSEVLKHNLGENIRVTYETVAKDIPGWDSLTHLNILSELEETFGIKFTFKEIRSFANVGKIVETLKNRTV